LDGLAAVALLDQREFVDVLGDLLRQLVEQAAAVGGADLVPHAFEAVARGAHGGVDVGGVAALDSSNTWPSDGSMTGRVRPETDGTEALAM
jgi:hypothetical protein